MAIAITASVHVASAVILARIFIWRTAVEAFFDPFNLLHSNLFVHVGHISAVHLVVNELFRALSSRFEESIEILVLLLYFTQLIR